MRFLLTALLLVSGSAPAADLPPAAQRLYDAARQGRDAQRIAEAEKLGARVFATSDGRSYVVAWQPAGATRWMVSLHGSEGHAMNDFAIWHRYLAPRGIAYLGLQWWNGQGGRPDDYLPPLALYRELDVAARSLGIASGSAVLHGFSRGSANLYAVAVLDTSSGRRLFSHFIANAGGAAADFPPNRALVDGRFGARPLADTRWITICGGRDPNPERDGCPAMRRTADWLGKQGARVVEAIEDPQGDHGVFHRNLRHVERVLDLVAARQGT